MRILTTFGILTSGAVANGGTGLTSYTIGDMIYASGTTTLSKLADVATGQLLASGGVGAAPAWSASPTLTTSLTTPLHIGGTAVGSTLTLKSTSGVGTTDAIIFQVGNNGATEAARFTTTGTLLVGTATPAVAQLVTIKKTIASASVNEYGLVVQPTFDSSVTTSGTGLRIDTATSAASFTQTNMYGIAVGGASVGAGSTVTTFSNIFLLDSSAPTNVYGIQGGVTSAANHYNLFLNGTAQNHIRGNLGLGASVTVPNYQLEVNGTIGLYDATGVTYDARLTRSSSSPYRILTILSNGGAAGWQGAIYNAVNYNAGTTINALNIVAQTNGTTANVGIEVTAPTNTLSLSGQAAKTIWMERHTTSNTAGNVLTIQAGGATSGATDKAGGQLLLKPGASTGQGRASIRLQNFDTALASGTSDNTAIDAVYCGTTLLTNNSATTITSFTLAADTAVAAVIDYAVWAVDTTNHKVQVETGSVAVLCGSNNAVQAGNTATKYGNIQYVGANALTCTWAISAANPAVVSLNANSTLTNLDSGYPKCRFVIKYLTNQAVTYA